MTFEEWCYKLSPKGKIKRFEGQEECEIERPHAGVVMEAMGELMEAAAKGKVPGLTTLFTTGTAFETDFAVYSEPELLNELLRIRYHRDTGEITWLWVNRRLYELVEIIEHE
jgi:hypothetical protein